MKGDGFDVKVKKGQAVKAGSALVAFDRDKVAKAGYDDTVIMAVSNSGDLEEQGCRVKVAEAENVEVSDTLITVAR
ncbi:PTS glucose transporter subunit IIA, partial [Parafannyhessea umbonata]